MDRQEKGKTKGNRVTVNTQVVFFQIAINK